MRLFIGVMLLVLSAFVASSYADKGEMVYSPPAMQDSLSSVGDRQLPEDLLGSDLTSLKVRISDLDRKVSGLERENRDLEDKLRGLQRTVDDLKRRASR